MEDLVERLRPDAEDRIGSSLPRNRQILDHEAVSETESLS